jgi:hypothetical protein
VNENLNLFAVPPEVERGEPSVEPEREEISEQPGSIRWYAEMQRRYWNEAFPWAEK